MMKNIYSLNSASLSEDGFELDIFYEDFESGTLKRFIPEPGFDRTPLLNLFQEMIRSQMVFLILFPE